MDNIWEIISGVLGILGFVGSVINLIYTFMISRKKLNLWIGSYGIKPYFQGEEFAIVRYRIDNLSQMAITITRIKLIVDGKAYDSHFVPEIADDRKITKGDEIIYSQTTATDVVPINLEPLASRGGFLGFAIPQDTLPTGQTNLTLEICTNRGKATQKTVTLNEDILFH